MEEVKLDPRLSALLPTINEFRALRDYLRSINDAATAPDMTYAIKWIDDSLNRLEPLMHSRFWPPICWRLSKEDFDLVIRNFYRCDADGAFESVQQRDEIISWVERIDAIYKQSR